MGRNPYMVGNQGRVIAIPEVPDPECVPDPGCDHTNYCDHDEGPFKGLEIQIGLPTLRRIAETIRRDDGGFTTEQVRAFLLLYDEELKQAINNTVKDFLRKKLGK